MTMSRFIFGLAIRSAAALFLLPGGGRAATEPAAMDYSTPSAWTIEQAAGGRVEIRNGRIVIQDTGGCTVWLKEKLTAPVAISYTVTPILGQGPQDRVSDVNCFWMARDSRSPDAPFAPRNARS